MDGITRGQGQDAAPQEAFSKDVPSDKVRTLLTRGPQNDPRFRNTFKDYTEEDYEEIMRDMANAKLLRRPTLFMDKLTAAVKPTFRDAWKSHRCIVPASYYFEWEHMVNNRGKKHTGDKYMIQPAGDSMTWLCGLYRIENNFPVFVVLTREPGGQIRFFHDRMPLILTGELVNDWIRPDTKPENLLGNALTDMVFEKVVEG